MSPPTTTTTTTTTTTSPKRLLLPLLLLLTLTFLTSTTTTDARAISQKRSPDSNDDNNNGGHINVVDYPVGKHDGGHSPFTPGNGGGSLSTNKRRKRSDAEVIQVEATEAGAGRTFEKRNLFSRLLNTIRDRGRHPRDHRPSHKPNVNSFNDQNKGDTADVEEYSYWNAEEEDEEGIAEEDDLERHGEIYEDDDSDNVDKGGFEDFGLVSQGVARASIPIVIEPFIRHPAHGSSLFDTDNNQVQIEDSNNHGESSNNNNNNNNNIDSEDEDLARLRANQPWYQQQHYPSSSSSSKQHADNENENDNEYDSNILRSQIWIVDEWDEDFDGVEETIDDLIDWIDDLDHVRAPPASAPAAAGSSGVRHLFF